MGVPADRIATIPNAWRPPSVAAPRPCRVHAPAWVSTGTVPLLGWVGRLSHVKGADIALAALARLRNDSARLVFVGDGPDRPALEAQAAALGVASRVRFAGMVPQASSILPAFDALVLSSRSEGTPMILLETIHAGVPIVASAVGGVPDLLPAGTALLVPPNDPAALATAMDEVLADRGAAVPVRRRRERASPSSSLPANGSVAIWRCTSVSWSVAPVDVRFGWPFTDRRSRRRLFGYALAGYPLLLWILSRLRAASAHLGRSGGVAAPCDPGAGVQRGGLYRGDAREPAGARLSRSIGGRWW